MIYLIFNSEVATEVGKYELCTDDIGVLQDIQVDGLFYHDYPQKLRFPFNKSSNGSKTLSSYLSEYPELVLVGSFPSLDHYNQFLDDSPEFFL